jgi:hypothetical protein
MRKFLLLSALTVSLIVFGIGSAFAFSLAGGYLGPIKFKFSDWSNGDTYTYNSGTNAFTNTGDGQVLPGGTHLNANNNEDAWGIFKVTGIYDLVANPLWETGSAPEELVGIYWGIDDDYLAVTTGGYELEAVKGHMAIYYDNAKDFDPMGGPGLRNPAFNTNVMPVGTPQYPTVNPITGTGGLFFSADFVPGVKWGDGNVANDHITYSSVLTATDTPFTAKGNFYMDITGGDYAWMFDSDGYALTDDSGGTAKRDLFAQFDAKSPGDYNWLANSEDPVLGHAVPEPGTMLLLGSGLLALAGFGRKKLNKKS